MSDRPTVENPHKNHRARLRARFLASGLSDFAPHNVLELLLFYGIPRRDTNPIAHALLDRFGTVGGVLSATTEELCQVPGVSFGVARFFSSLRSLWEVAGRTRAIRRRYSSAEKLGELFAEALRPCHDDGIAYAFFDNDYCLISLRTAFGVSIHSPGFCPTSIVEEALLRHAPICAVAHVHADGLALPTSPDLDMTRMLRGMMESAGVRLAEHFIVDGDRYTTLLYRYSGSRGAGASADGAFSINDGEVVCLSEFFSLTACRANAEELILEHGTLFRLLAAPAGRHLYSGIDERTAALLALPFAVHAYVAAERPAPMANEVEELGRHLSMRYFGVGEETVLLLLFDKKGRHLATHTVSVGSVGEAPLSCRRIAEKALFQGAKGAVIAHNHPDGSVTPSEEDRSVTAMVAEALRGIGVEFLRHYIVAGDDFSIIE